MKTDTIEGTLEREDTHTNSELKLAEVQAEIERQDGQAAGSLADLLVLHRAWSDDLDRFRAELTAWREEGLLDVHMPDGPEARRRRGLLAPLAHPQPGPYNELAPANLDAEHQARQQHRGWVPKVPEGAGPTSILDEPAPATQVAASAPTSNKTAPELDRRGWLRRTLTKVWNWDGSGA